MFNEYLGIPFKSGGRDRNGIDCYGIILLIYKEKKGIQLFDIEKYDSAWGESENYFISNYHKSWEKIEIKELQPFDVILFRIDTIVPQHVGLYTGEGKFIHCMETMPVGISKLNNRPWPSYIDSAYRYKGEK
jgi:cell wall-associated NlpC family hydrolase